MLNYRFVIPLGLIALVAVLPVFVPWAKIVLTLAFAKGLAVLGIIVLLRAGQVSFGHALYFGVAAYASAFLGRQFAGGELISMLLVGLLVSGALSIVVGLFVVRYRGIFFGMLNLAFSMILYSVLEKFYHLTGGSDGMQVARPTVLGLSLERDNFEVLLFYGTVLAAISAGFAVHKFLRSPIGQIYQAIATNETRLEYLGVSARNTLLTGYVISAVLCGLGGSIMAVAQGIVTPEYTWWIRSGEFVFIAVLGGSGSVGGAFIGAITYELVRTYAAAFAADIWQMVLGFFLLGIILYASRGLYGLYDDLLKPLDLKLARSRGAGK